MINSHSKYLDYHITDEERLIIAILVKKYISYVWLIVYLINLSFIISEMFPVHPKLNSADLNQ
jgi:hypothetical protein